MPAATVFMVHMVWREGDKPGFAQQRMQFLQRPPAEQNAQNPHQRIAPLLQPETAQM